MKSYQLNSFFVITTLIIFYSIDLNFIQSKEIIKTKFQSSKSTNENSNKNQKEALLKVVETSKTETSQTKVEQKENFNNSSNLNNQPIILMKTKKLVTIKPTNDKRPDEQKDNNGKIEISMQGETKHAEIINEMMNTCKGQILTLCLLVVLVLTILVIGVNFKNFKIKDETSMSLINLDSYLINNRDFNNNLLLGKDESSRSHRSDSKIIELKGRGLKLPSFTAMSYNNQIENLNFNEKEEKIKYENKTNPTKVINENIDQYPKPNPNINLKVVKESYKYFYTVEDQKSIFSNITTNLKSNVFNLVNRLNLCENQLVKPSQLSEGFNNNASCLPIQRIQMRDMPKYSPIRKEQEQQKEKNSEVGAFACELTFSSTNNPVLGTNFNLNDTVDLEEREEYSKIVTFLVESS